MNLSLPPLGWFLVIMLSIGSTFYCWTGFRDKNISHLLFGFGLGLPTFDVTDWRLWLAGTLTCFLGKWLGLLIGSP